MKRKKPVLLESFYNKNGLPETFFELRSQIHQKIIDKKAKTGEYQKNAFDKYCEGDTYYLHTQRVLDGIKEYKNIVHNFKSKT